MKALRIEHPAFSIIGWESKSLQSNRLAPGMDVSYVLKFTPQEDVDYYYDLICCTERESFAVPIRAIGSKGFPFQSKEFIHLGFSTHNTHSFAALFDLPDVIHFSQCPVRFNTQKTLHVRNIGRKGDWFQIECDHPFHVEPARGFIAENDSVQIDVSFCSTVLTIG